MRCGEDEREDALEDEREDALEDERELLVELEAEPPGVFNPFNNLFRSSLSLCAINPAISLLSAHAP
jgi:hypothetical protein